ncbi:RNA polymerase sigma-70 ECF-like [Candidatus Nanopelagicaceae bacterium]
MTWQDEVSAREWDEWQKLARKLSKSKKQATSLGAEDYAAQAIEKLLQQETRPVNIEGWLALTINRQFIDRFRKIQARGGGSNRNLTDEQWENEMICHAVRSPSIIIQRRDQVEAVLSLLNQKEKEILILSAAGYDNHEIAIHLEYGSNKIVATRLAQIKVKIQNGIGKMDSSQ